MFWLMAKTEAAVPKVMQARIDTMAAIRFVTVKTPFLDTIGISVHNHYTTVFPG